ncbi:MAG: ribonuclease PH [Deltaproteobacteria bacterium]|nr:ribonuclease PH [Deltaproteobacteria bacterium]
MRTDGRKADELRPVKITRGAMKYPEGSALIEMGETKVICTATIEESVPPFLRETGKGWITAEYSMLPRSTKSRNTRDAVRGRVGGRSQEIQRIVGRALRAVVNMDKLGERTIIVDCDVFQADGGTRTASITGAFVALTDAVQYLLRDGILQENPIIDFVAAVSVGMIDGKAVLDLSYEEDSKAELDMNVAMTASRLLVEVQGTAERKPFSKDELSQMINIAEKGILRLIAKQREILAD